MSSPSNPEHTKSNKSPSKYISSQQKEVKNNNNELQTKEILHTTKLPCLIIFKLPSVT
jgi:hypothetical protein